MAVKKSRRSDTTTDDSGAHAKREVRTRAGTRVRRGARTKNGTRTSGFGSPGRENHDSSAFYASRLYLGLPQERPVDYVETPVPPEALDQIFCHSSTAMHELPDGSVHLMVTSPPYNVGKEYDADLTLDEYRSFLLQVWREVIRVLVPGGRLCINLANLGRRPYLPLHAFVIQDLLSLGLLMRGEILWNKAASSSTSTAWGSWCSPQNPTLRDVHEYILVFSKDSFSRPRGDRQSTIRREEFLAFTRSIWTFPAETARKVGHPAPFPVELPYRLIQLYTFEGEVVLDPFMGSGQTALAAIRAGRHYVGYEIEARYVALAQERVDAFRARAADEAA
ncbi:MAG: site-specific DNA-methyltransferase [Chloroflexi bacterium]|nr:site-specific DNA-methyltransferase [Chloroflexota bacterium]